MRKKCEDLILYMSEEFDAVRPLFVLLLLPQHRVIEPAPKLALNEVSRDNN